MGTALALLFVAIGGQVIHTFAVSFQVVSLLACLCVLVFVLVLRQRWRNMMAPSRRSNIAILSILIVGWLSFLPIFRENRIPPNFPLILNGDASVREALSMSLHEVGVFDSLLVPNGNVRYHWFGNSWVGTTDALGIASPFVVQTRVLPLVALICVVLISFDLGQRLTSRTLPAVMGSLMAVAGGALSLGVAHSGGALTEPFGISAATGVVGALATFCAWSAGEKRGWTLGRLTILGLCAALATGGRVSAGLVVAAGAASVPLVAILNRQRLRRQWISSAVVIGSVGVTFFLLLVPRARPGIDQAAAWGLAPNLDFPGVYGLIPLFSPLGYGVAVVAVLISLIFPLVGIAVLTKSLEPGFALRLCTWAAAAAAAGVFGVLLTQQIGFSQFAFIGAALLPGLILSGNGAGLACLHLWQKSRGLIYLLVSTGLIFALGGLALASLHGVRFDGLLRTAAPFGILAGTLALGVTLRITYARRYRLKTLQILAIVSLSTTLATGFCAYFVRSVATPLVSPDALMWGQHDLLAASWLRQNVPLDALVATNRQCDSPTDSAPECVSTVTNIAGLAHRRAYSEGATYTVGSFDPATLQRFPAARERILKSLLFATRPSILLRNQMWEQGVRYMVIDERYPHASNFEPEAHRVFQSGPVLVLQLEKPL
jgi:hypothetical protein